MPIILNMSKEEFDNMRKQVAELNDMEQRLDAMTPLTQYEYLEEMLDEEGWKTQLATVEAERDEYKQKYIERFFSGVGLIDKEHQDIGDIKGKENPLSPNTYEELLTEEE